MIQVWTVAVCTTAEWDTWNNTCGLGWVYKEMTVKEERNQTGFQPAHYLPDFGTPPFPLSHTYLHKRYRRQAMSEATCLSHLPQELSICLFILSALPLYPGKLYSNHLSLM